MEINAIVFIQVLAAITKNRKMEEALTVDSFKFLGFLFKKEIAIGDLLTSITIMASFVVWLFSTIKTKRDENRQEQKNGALRFLLKILREKDHKIFTFEELKKEFESGKRKEERKIYCGLKFRFENKSEFEAAIYRLDWESKIDFLTTNTIKFRTDTIRSTQIMSAFGDLDEITIKEIKEELLDKIKQNEALSYEEEKILKGMNYLTSVDVEKSLSEIVKSGKGKSRLQAMKLLTEVKE